MKYAITILLLAFTALIWGSLFASGNEAERGAGSDDSRKNDTIPCPSCGAFAFCVWWIKIDQKHNVETKRHCIACNYEEVKKEKAVL